MKKGLLIIFCAFIGFYSLTAQRITSLVPDYKSNLKKYVQSVKTKQLLNSKKIKTRSFNEDYFLNYTMVEQPFAKNNNTDALYVTFMKLNSNFTKQHFGGLKDLYQHIGTNGEIYNILGFSSAQSKYVYSTVDLSKTSLILDSFNLKLQHTRVNNSKNDTIIVSVYDNSQVTIPTQVVTGNYPNWTSTQIAYSGILYSDTLIVSSQLAYNDTLPFSTPFLFTNRTYKPNLTLPAGKSFGLRVQFYGDTANYVTPLFTSRDECNDACLQSPAAVRNTSGFLFLPFNRGTANEINYSGTLNAQGVFFFCENDEPCEYWYAQNWDIDYFVHSNTQFNVKIDPLNTYIGCAGSSVDLASSYSGLDTLKKVTFLWKALGGGTFENGKDTITGAGASYTYDTLGGYKFIILKGTPSAGPDTAVSDTIVLSNFSMKPVLTQTGTIGCATKDSVLIRFNTTANIGISNNIITANTTGSRNLTLFPTYNAYFGMTYTWSNSGNFGRSDTTYIYTKTPGTYTVTVTNFAGCTATATVTTNNPKNLTLPVLNYTNNPLNNICPNKEISYINLSSKKTGWNFNWQEGATSLSTETDSFIHIFTTSGAKTVVLSADTPNCPNLKPISFSKPITVLPSTDTKCKSSINQTSLDQQVSIYPNPSKDGRFTISSSTTTPLNVNITDILGKTVYSQNLGTISKQVINLGNVQNGVYFIEINNGSSTTIQKLIMDK
jgi:hypothetical protein